MVVMTVQIVVACGILEMSTRDANRRDIEMLPPCAMRHVHYDWHGLAVGELSNPLSVLT